MTEDLYPMSHQTAIKVFPESLGYPLECWSTLAGLAAITEKIGLGSLVSCVRYRNPTLLGKIATTVDIISNGRLILGMGAGWHETESKAYFGRFPSVKERLDALEEAAQILRGMLRKRETTFIGELYRVENLVNLPRPVQDPIPLMIGGCGERRTLRIVAKYGDISHFGNLQRKIRVLKEHCRRVGRDFSEITLATGATPSLEGEPFPSEFIRSIETAVELGVKIVTIRFFALKDRAPEIQRRFAKEIMPSFKT